MMKTFLNNISYENLTDTESVILDYFKENVKKVIYSSLSEICDELYVSNASIIRFCQKIGFRGYNDFKFKLKTDLSRSTFSSDFWTIIPQNTEVLKDFADSLNENQMNQICDYILTNKSIYIYGQNMSSFPAKYLYSMLLTMDIRCILINWHEFLISLSSTMPENSILILFTNYGDKKSYSSVIEQCRKRNIKIIWISSKEIDFSLVQEDDIYICANEVTISTNALMTKMTSLLFVQIIIEMLMQKR